MSFWSIFARNCRVKCWLCTATGYGNMCSWYEWQFIITNTILLVSTQCKLLINLHLYKGVDCCVPLFFSFHVAWLPRASSISKINESRAPILKQFFLLMLNSSLLRFEYCNFKFNEWKPHDECQNMSYYRNYQRHKSLHKENFTTLQVHLSSVGVHTLMFPVTP